MPASSPVRPPSTRPSGQLPLAGVSVERTYRFATIESMTAADLQATIAHMGAAARAASARMRAAPTAAKDAALRGLARRLRAEGAALAAANLEDVTAARAAGLADPL